MSTRLYVGGLSPKADDQDLQTLFQDAGIEPESVAVARDHKRDRSRCFAFVELSSEDEAQAAIDRLDGKELGERTLKVGRARHVPEVHGGFGKPEGFHGIHGKDGETGRRRKGRR